MDKETKRVFGELVEQAKEAERQGRELSRQGKEFAEQAQANVTRLMAEGILRQSAGANIDNQLLNYRLGRRLRGR